MGTAHGWATAWNTVSLAAYLVSFLIVARLSWMFLRNHATHKSILTSVMDHGPFRASVGFLLLSLGNLVRLGAWYPWRAMEDAGYPLAAWWEASLTPYTNGLGTLLVTAGASLVMWPSLQKWTSQVFHPSGVANATTVGVILLTGTALVFMAGFVAHGIMVWLFTTG